MQNSKTETHGSNKEHPKTHDWPIQEPIEKFTANLNE